MSKKFKLSLVAIAIIAIAGTCVGCSDSKTENTSTTVATTTATQAQTEKATEAPTQAQTEKATEAPEQNNAEQATQAPAPQNEDYDSPEPTIPNVVGVWKNKDYPDSASVEVVNQAGNTIDIIISSTSSNASHIATAKASVSLEVSPGSSSVTGSGTFDYTDSFGNSGTGIIGVNESAITLNITEEYNDNRGWGISKASGKYLPPYAE